MWSSDSLGSFFLVTSLLLVIFLMQQELVNQKDCPYMCAYKLVTVKFKWWGLQNKVENFIHKVSMQDGAFHCVSVFVLGRAVWPSNSDLFPHLLALESLVCFAIPSFPLLILSYSLMLFITTCDKERN